MKKSALCGLGQTAPNPVLSTLKFFYHEYEELLNGPKTEKKEEPKEQVNGCACNCNCKRG